MTREDLLRTLRKMTVWKRRDERAPHKPLLLLLTLGRLQRGEERFASYEQDVRSRLRRMLRDFGPQRRVYHPENPFWHLRSDGIWEISDAELGRILGGRSPSDRMLRDRGVRGGLTESAHRLLARDPALVQEVARLLLDRHFPESIHDEVVDAAGLVLGADLALHRAARDPKFRDWVLTAYERRCAVCDYDMRIDDSLIGLEAAHIRWHAHNGPDAVNNGLALCTLHHKTFDRGAIGLERSSAGYRLVVSDTVNGRSLAFRQLLDHHGQPIRNPQRHEHRPRPEYVNWHRKQVFRGRPRDL